MSRLWHTHGHTDTHVKVEQYSAEAESAINQIPENDNKENFFILKYG